VTPEFASFVEEFVVDARERDLRASDPQWPIEYDACNCAYCNGYEEEDDA
jgi:hypothetical protein